MDVLDNGRAPRLVIDFPLCCGLASWGYATIVAPEGAVGVDGGIMTFQNPRRQRKFRYSPGLSESVLGTAWVIALFFLEARLEGSLT